jgi:DNA replication protein DnaC
MKPKILIESDIQHIHQGKLIPGVFEVAQTCDGCGKVYTALTYQGRLWTTGRCIPCSDVWCKDHEDEEVRGMTEKRKVQFNEICPAKYQEFKRELLPNKVAYDAVLSWDYGKKGLLLMGDSERGKTRCAWRLLSRLYMIDWLPFKAITELQFSHEVAKFGKSEALTSWIKDLCHVKVLFIDDLGKCVMTERVVSELFYLLEERMSNDRPIIATMQLGADRLIEKIASRAGKDMADAIFNRLTSNCEIVRF